jgi:TupA-like ATPgrasp
MTAPLKLVEGAYHFGTDRLPDYAAINLMYFRHFGRLPDLKNPQTFNEKIAWRKLYQRDSRFSVFADKIAVKEQVGRLLGGSHIIETLWIGDDPADIPLNSLKLPYVIKVTHGSGWNIFVRKTEDIDRKRIISAIQKQLRVSHGHRYREWGYLAIPRKVMIEPMVEIPAHDVPEDYKFFVYHGRCHFIQVDFDRFKWHRRNLYDREWNLLPARLFCPTGPTDASKPPQLNDMIKIAEKIGAQFDFVRVDLYSTATAILFGEVTFYPGAGHERFAPSEWDHKFGGPWSVRSREAVAKTS